MWGGDPPEAARNALQSYVSRLRRALGDGGRIEGRPPGYVLHVEPEGPGTVRLYLLGIAELVELARQRVTRALVDEECRTYLHVPSCPGADQSR